MILIQTNKPIAIDSQDHLFPCGTAQDNSVRPEFNQTLFSLIPARFVKFLDLGCAGGGLVESILNDGAADAIGLEGSDYSLKMKRASWATIPDNLATVDLSEPFTILYRQNYFNVITAWEFFEHIKEDKLDNLFINIRKHAARGALLIASIADFPHEEYHVTIRPKGWWIDRFTQGGFIHEPQIEHIFSGKMVRTAGFPIVLTVRTL